MSDFEAFKLLVFQMREAQRRVSAKSDSHSLYMLQQLEKQVDQALYSLYLESRPKPKNQHVSDLFPDLK